MWGATLAAALVDEIDELVLKVVLGAGVPLFARVVGPRTLTMTTHRVYDNGYAVLRYWPPGRSARRVTSIAGFGTAVAFALGPAGTLAFAIWALLWFATTTAALRAVRKGRIAQHRRWMVRSVALSLVFAVFSCVQPALLDAALPREVAYPLALLGSVAVVLAGAHFTLRGPPGGRRGLTPHPQLPLGLPGSGRGRLLRPRGPQHRADPGVIATPDAVACEVTCSSSGPRWRTRCYGPLRIRARRIIR